MKTRFLFSERDYDAFGRAGLLPDIGLMAKMIDAASRGATACGGLVVNPGAVITLHNGGILVVPSWVTVSQKETKETKAATSPAGAGDGASLPSVENPDGPKQEGM